MNEEKKPSATLTETELTLMTVQLNLTMLRGDVELIERHVIQRLDEVYYHVFPDRLAQDAKFGQQLLDLMKHSPRPDADKKQ
jgi:hypothetical protein